MLEPKEIIAYASKTMLKIPNSVPWKGKNAITLPRPSIDNIPIPQGTQTGTAIPIIAPKVPVLLIFPLIFPFECILNIIRAPVIPNSKLIMIKIIEEWNAFLAIPS